MCCEYCSQGSDDKHYRHGHRTQYGCASCEVNFQKEATRKDNPMAARRINVNTIDDIFPLCNRKRFESVGDNRTCFQIYHEEGIQGTQGMYNLFAFYVIDLSVFQRYTNSMTL